MRCRIGNHVDTRNRCAKRGDARSGVGCSTGERALLLRLSEHFKGSGRVVIADSAFASVKSAVNLKTRHGLHFLGLVKTATREFPKKYLNDIQLERRGDSVVLTTVKDNVNLRAVAWNEGERDKKTRRIIKKNFIATCGTTLPGRSHFKRRRGEFEVPRPELVAEYLDGAQQIDVHNHVRQGVLAMEPRPTRRWMWRFFQTFIGLVEVDAYLAYRKFCPGKTNIPHRTFLIDVIGALLNNKYGLSESAPVLRPPSNRNQRSTVEVHSMRSLVHAQYFARKIANAKAANLRPPRARVHCRVCGRLANFFCELCTPDAAAQHPTKIFAVCGPSTDRNCFTIHQRADPDDPPPRARART